MIKTNKNIIIITQLVKEYNTEKEVLMEFIYNVVGFLLSFYIVSFVTGKIDKILDKDKEDDKEN